MDRLAPFLIWIVSLAAGVVEPGQANQDQPERRPEESRALVLKGENQLVLGAVEMAIGSFDEAIKADADNARAHLLLGRALMLDSLDRDLDEALEQLSKANDLGARHAPVFRARCLTALGREAEARKALLSFFAVNVDEEPQPATGLAHLDWARSLTDSGELEKATRSLEAATQVLEQIRSRPRDAPPLSPQDRVDLGDIQQGIRRGEIEVLLAKKDFEQARIQAMQIVVESPQDLQSREILAQALDGLGKPKAAAKQRRAIEILPHLQRIVGMKSKPLSEVEALVAEMSKIPPPFVRGPLLLARACTKRGQHEKAIEVVTQKRKQLGKLGNQRRLVAETWFIEGEARRELGDNRRALGCYETAAKLEPGFRAQYQKMLKKLR